jgi:hypothetical protein
MTASSGSHVTELGDSHSALSHHQASRSATWLACPLHHCQPARFQPLFAFCTHLLAAPVWRPDLRLTVLTPSCHAASETKQLCSALSTCRTSSCECVTGCCSTHSYLPPQLVVMSVSQQQPPAHFPFALVKQCTKTHHH